MSKHVFKKNDLMDTTQLWKENSEEGYVRMLRSIITSKPFGDNKFYIHQFVKRVDDTSGVKKMYHHPRLTKPRALPGSTLLRCDPRDPDTVMIMWTIPNEETFGLYACGKMFADEQISEWVAQFIKDPDALSKPEPDDLSDEQIREIYAGMKKKNVFNAKTSSEADSQIPSESLSS